MSNEGLPVILSDWYELVTGDELMQGDLLENCPVFRPPVNLNWPIKDGEEPEFTVERGTMVIMSQSCDLQADQKSDMWLVLLSPVWKLLEAAKVNQFLAASIGKEECRRGNMAGYHMIAGCDHDQWKREISIVSFREVWSLPLNFVRHMARQIGTRPRIRSPYREHLAQTFARNFMRVGLPVDIPPFKSDKAETEVMRKLNALDEETRRRIIESFI
jgi:hypothetical protein